VVTPLERRLSVRIMRSSSVGAKSGRDRGPFGARNVAAGKSAAGGQV
jgi:hypothetical protein